MDFSLKEQKILDELKCELKPITKKEREHCEFMAKWEAYLPEMSDAELQQQLDRTSPHHPSENMGWLYDRLLSVRVERIISQVV